MSSILKKKNFFFAYLLCFLSLSIYNHIWLNSHIWTWESFAGRSRANARSRCCLRLFDPEGSLPSDPSQNKRQICPISILRGGTEANSWQCRIAIFIPDSRNYNSKITVNSKRTLIQMRNILTRKGKPSLSSSFTLFI